MVGIASDKGAVGEGPERLVLVLALLLYKERLLVDTAVIGVLEQRHNPESALRSLGERVVDKNLVVDAPLVLVAERTVSGLDHRKERIEEIILANLVKRLASVEP